MNKKIYFLLGFILLIVIIVIVSKKSAPPDEVDIFDNLPATIEDVEGALPLDTSAVIEIVENISSPIETAALVQSLGVPFSRKYLATTDNIDQFFISFDQAFNLGVFGADLGYLNIYSKTGPVIEYITAIKNLADKLRVGQFFDFNTLRRLATNNENIDSLTKISIHSFNLMDTYLRENKRSSLSILMITGVWIEGLYLATQVASENPSSEIAEKIGEQKLILAELMPILKNYKNNKYFKGIIKDLEKIKTLYQDVTIVYEPGEPEVIEKDGMLTFVQNDRSIVTISDEQLQKIIRKTKEIRNKLIGS